MKHETDTPSGREVSRRTIVTSSAWAVPAVLTAVAVSSASASTGNGGQPDLAITWHQNAPSNGNDPNFMQGGRPGYFPGRQITHHIRIANMGDADSGTFVVEVQMHASSYQNGSAEVSGSGWVVSGVRPNGNLTVTVTLTYTDSLAAGQVTNLYVRTRVSSAVPNPVEVAPTAAITAIENGDSDRSNNLQRATSYWVRSRD